jgi:Acetyltransferase (GNAT) family.
MVFLLTGSLSEKIVRAMENQEEKFLLCAENLTLVSAKTANVDDENYYSLPEWDSSSGFELREDFVASLQNPMAHDKLQAVLHSGRGVFRNFKDELKKNPVIERQWHIFKNKKMLEKVGDWYNGLREIWGLEKLDLAPEDNEYILLDDFTFIPYTKSDSQIICGIADTADDFEGNLPSQVKDAVHELWRRNFLFGDSLSQTGFICNTLSNEFAGCITAAPVSKRTEKIMILTSFFVPEKFRGLGIGTELLNKCLSDLKTLKKEGILLLNTIIPDSMESLLLNSGFRKVGSGYLAEI